MTTVSKYYVGDVGTEVLVDTLSDISTATSVKLAVMKPNEQKEVLWTGVVSDTTKIQYYTQNGDFDVPGRYLLQAVVVTPTWSGRGETTRFTVYAKFA